ncbi:MAG: 3-dehydroquinate synthase II family protein [Desulfovibrio sp.]|jgi:3-dehydroquinate synthase II|nr:3-dehydroquinate synthase II family protein [Desulfovibrio sp.]
MKKILFKAVPFHKEEVTLALESGVDGLLVPRDSRAAAASLARCLVLEEGEVEEIALVSREEESRAAALMRGGGLVALRRGWEIIPVENLLARGAAGEGSLALETATPDEAALAAGILEKGADAILILREGLSAIKDIVDRARSPERSLPLAEAVVTHIAPAGMGHRVCVDTLSLFSSGQGMLTGNSAAFTFLVNAETEHNEYVASRPFRINAGAVHSYALMPGDRTAYLEELRAGQEVLIASHEGVGTTAVVGRIKVERRPMLLLRARAGDEEGAVFLQNAETIRLVRPGGGTVSVVALAPGDTVLCRLDEAGRHFGLRIKETIREE